MNEGKGETMTPEERERLKGLKPYFCGGPKTEAAWLVDLAEREAKRADEWYEALTASKGEGAEVLRRVAVERDAAIREGGLARTNSALLQNRLAAAIRERDEAREKANWYAGEETELRAKLERSRAEAAAMRERCANLVATAPIGQPLIQASLAKRIRDTV